jgi:Uncharacterized protein conserved in bacteria
MRQARCPHCGAATRLTPDNDWRPFCSRRCKLIDLGDWLEERNALPARDDDVWPSTDPTTNGPPRHQ